MPLAVLRNADLWPHGVQVVDDTQQMWACALIKAKKEAGEKLTSREEAIWAYSRHGSAASCHARVKRAARPTNITQLVERQSEN